MGCGMSKYAPEDAVLFCEFNPRQNNLHPIDQDVCSDNKADHHCQNSITSPAKDNGVVKENKKENERGLETKEVETEKEPGKKVSTAKAVPEEEGLHQEEIKVSRQNHEEGEEEEEEEEKENELSHEREDSITAAKSLSFRDCIIGPGSPSFRLYCRDSDSKGSSKNDDNGDGAKSESESGKESNPEFNKSSRTKIAKKERKRRRLMKNILYKGRSAGAK